MKYTQLSLEERERMYCLKSQGYSLRDIGERLNRSHTTFSRELKRNAKYHQEYIPCKAHCRYIKRCIKQRRKAPLKSPEILLYVRAHLKEWWSPEIISGRLKLEKGLSIHQETIYRYIYSKDNRRERLWEYLTFKRKKRMKSLGRSVHRASRIKHSISIEQREEDIQTRKEYGHWETDLMLGSKTNKHALLVNVERKTRYSVISRLPNKTSQTVSSNMIRILKQFQPKTITSDNGLENTKHEYVSQILNTKYFFCHPYSSWEKGTVENRIGVIRRYIPKGEDIQIHSHTQIQLLQDQLNNRPMKCLGYLKPLEAIRKEGIMI
jgi:transposase, IS30 family